MVKDRGLEDWKSNLHAVSQLGFTRLDISRYVLKHYLKKSLWFQRCCLRIPGRFLLNGKNKRHQNSEQNDCESEAFLDSRRSRSLFGWRRRREDYG